VNEFTVTVCFDKAVAKQKEEIMQLVVRDS